MSPHWGFVGDSGTLRMATYAVNVLDNGVSCAVVSYETMMIRVPIVPLETIRRGRSSYSRSIGGETFDVVGDVEVDMDDSGVLGVSGL